LLIREGDAGSFFNWQGIMHDDFTMTNSEMYKEVFAYLWEVICLKNPKMWSARDWVFLKENVLAHRSLLVQKLLTKHDIVVLPGPLYPPSLVKCNFYLFPWMKDWHLQVFNKRSSGIED
jgi:hypothetical protein